MIGLEIAHRERTDHDQRGGDYPEAQASIEEALDIVGQRCDRPSENFSLGGLARVATAVDDLHQRGTEDRLSWWATRGT